MSHSEKSQLIRLFSHTHFARDLRAFLIDRQARGLSPRTVQFYQYELSKLYLFLDDIQIRDVENSSVAISEASQCRSPR